MVSSRIAAVLTTAFTTALAALVLGLPPAPAGATLPQHVIKNVVAAEYPTRPNHFYVKGNAVTAKGRKVFLQHKVSGVWRNKTYDVAAAGSGFFKISFTDRVGVCFRLLIKATPAYRTTTRRIGCIVRG